MGLHDIIEGKRKWRAHKARVDALPRDYQIVYKELQKYLFKVGPVEMSDGMGPLAGIVDLFEEGAAAGKSALEVTGKDVAAFCDALIEGSETVADTAQEHANRRTQEAVRKSTFQPTVKRDGKQG